MINYFYGILKTNVRSCFSKQSIFLFILTFVFQQSIAQNMGFEAPSATPPTGWVPVTLTWSHNTNQTFVRTGGNSMTVTDPATSGSTIGCTNGFVTTAAPGSFLITIAWGKSNTAANASFYLGYRTGSTNTLNPSTTATPPAQYVLNNTTWTRISSASAATVAAGSYGPALRAFRQTSTTGTQVYMDDFIIYASPSNVPDLTAPNPAAGATIAGNVLSWANGSDNGAPASGISGLVIVRADGVSLPSPTLNDQAMYATTNGTAGTSSFVSGANTWTVVANIAGNATTSFTDATAGAGPYTYAIFMRDMAYNYSTGAVVTAATPCTNPVTAGTFNANPSTPVCSGTSVSLSLIGGTGGTGQTYQWQSSLTAGGSYTNVSGVLSNSSFTINPTSTLYYRCEIICSAGVPAYSTPAQVIVNLGLSGTFTINSTLATGGLNYQTFADAISAMTACGISGPVTFNVDAASGPYNEQVIIPVIPGTSVTNTVTFNGNGRTLTFAGTTAERAVVKLNGADFITLNNFVINSTSASFAFGVQIINDADNNTISNCTINSDTVGTSTTAFAGIVINSSASSVIGTGASLCDSNTISSNIINGGYAGVSLAANGTTSTIYNNKVINNTIRDFYEYGVFVNGNNNALIEGNDITRPNRSVVTTYRGIGLSGVSLNTRVSKNRLHNPFGNAPASTAAAFMLYLTSCNATVGNENILSNNILYDHIGGTGNHNGFLNNISSNVKFYHNTIYLNDVTATCTNCAARGIYQQGTAPTGLDYRNNIVVITQGGASPKQCIFFEAASVSGYLLNNNDYYITSTGGTFNEIARTGGSATVPATGTGYATLSAWQTGSGQEGLSVSADPFFVNAPAGILQPSSGSVNNIGAPVGILTDITNAARSNTTPDPGAYEFTPVANDLGATALISPVSTYNCYSNAETVTVRIQNFGTSVIDFTANPATVTCQVSGALTTTLNGTLTGTVPALSFIDFTFPGTINMSANGAYTFVAYTTLTGEGNTSNDTMPDVVRNKLAISGGTITVSNDTFCVSGSPVFTLSGNDGGAIQWQASTAGASGPWTNVGTGLNTYSPASVTQTTYYRAEIACYADTAHSNVMNVHIISPTILTTNSPVNLCGTGSVALIATHPPGNVINWYAAASGGLPIAIGDTFNTPVLAATTSYWASASTGGSTFFTSKLAPEAASTGTVLTTYGQDFTVTTPFILNSVQVFSTTGTSITIALYSSGGTTQLLTTGPVAVTAGSSPTINLGWAIAPGTYRLCAPGMTGNFIRDNTGVTYPFALSTIGTMNGFVSSITGAVTTSSSYYFMYNWSVSTGCESGRTQFTVNRVAGPTITASTLQSLVCSGGSTTVSVTSTNPGFNYKWLPGNIPGASISVAPVTSTVYTVIGLDTSGGAFNGCTELSTVNITAQPATVSINANPAAVCGASGSTTLSLSPSFAYPAGSVQWQNSSDGINYNDIIGATNTTYVSPVLSATTYYRAEIKDGNNNICSQPSLIFPVGPPQVLSTQDSSRCGVGTVVLQAAGSPGATLNWYASATGGLPLGTGGTFTTPVINTTTDFYAAAEVYGGTNTIAVGAGASTSATYSNPFYSAWSNTHNQHLITASELTSAGISAGLITSLGLNITSAGSLPMIDLSVKMGMTSATNMSSFVSTVFTTVFTAPSLMPVVGLNSMTFTTPFLWDGSSNIVIEICHGNPSSTSTMSRTAQTDATSYVSTIHVQKSAASAAAATCADFTTNLITYSVRPKFTFTNIPICSSVRELVKASVSPAPAINLVAGDLTVCPGNSTTLSVNSANDPNYTYTWTSNPAGFTASGGGPFTITPTSTRTYKVVATDTTGSSNGGCVAVDSVTIISSSVLIAGTISSPISNYCVSGTPVLTLTGNSGGSIQWQQSTASASGPWTNIGTGTNTFTPSSPLTQTTYFQVVVGCQSSSVNSPVYTVTVSSPQLLSTTPGSRCGTGTVTLSATPAGTATVNWYATPTSFIALGSGNSFTTPVLNSTTNFYAAPSEGASTANVGMASYPNATFSGGSGVATYGLRFDALSTFTLNSVVMYINSTSEGTSGTVTIGILDSITGNVLQQTTVNVTGHVQSTGLVPVTIPLNFVVNPGIGLRLVPISYTGVSSLGYVPSPCAACTYPYTMPGVVSIKYGTYTNSFHPELYYYFYNWSISTGCEGPRTLVTATVNPAPAINVVAASPAVCAGGSTTVSVSSPSNDPNYTYSWTSNPAGFTGTGAGPLTVSPLVNTTYIVTATDNTAGPNANCVKIDSVTVYTGAVLTAGTISSSQSTLCVSGTPVLTAAGAGGGVIQWQESTSGLGGPWNNVGTGGLTYTPSSAVNQTTSYRLQVSCPSNTTTSNTVTVTVNNPQLTGTTGASRCGAGTVLLTATSSPGSTISWYAAPTGGFPLGTGTSFTTPVVSSNTNFYAAAENGSASPVTSTVGAGAATSATYSNPFYSLWSNTHMQHLITASELYAAGLSAGSITSLGINITAAGTLPMIDFSMKIASTNATSMTAYVSPAFTTVYTSASFMPVTGLNTMNFVTPFIWDGISNIVIEICHGNPGSTATMSRTALMDNTSYVSTIHTHKTTATGGSAQCSDNSTNLTTYTVRPQFVFTYLPVCSGPRVAVLATVTPAPSFSVSTDKVICSDAVTPLSVTSNTASFHTYQWSPVTNLYTDASATTAYTGSSATTVYVKSNTAGPVNYVCFAQDTVTLCANIDTVKVTVQPGAVAITAAQNEFCVSGIASMSLNPSGPFATGSIQWRSSPNNVTYNDIPGANGNTYTTPTLTSTTYYVAQIKDGTGNVCLTTAPFTITVNAPAVTGTAPGTRCGLGTVTIGATASAGAILNWYTAASGGSPIATGPTYTTPVISSTTNYYVAANSGGGSNQVSNNGLPTVTTSTQNTGLLFDLNVDVTLNSIQVYSTAAGTVTVTLLNSALTTLFTSSAVPIVASNLSTPQTVNLGWNIPAGTNYRILVSNTGNALGYHTGAFPIPLGNGVGTITNGATATGTTTLNYFVYSMNTTSGCESGRTQVSATVTPGPPVSITGNLTVCQGSSTTLSVGTGLGDYSTFSWSPSTGLSATTGTSVVASPSASTKYYLFASGNPGNCQAVDSVIVNVNVIPLVVQVDNPLVCGNGTHQLNASAGAGTFSYAWSPSGGLSSTNIANPVATISGASQTYTVMVTNTASGCTKSGSVTLYKADPQLLSTTGDTRCGVGQVSLTASGTSGQVNWYNQAAGGVLLNTGSPYTPTVSSTTTFYASARENITQTPVTTGFDGNIIATDPNAAGNMFNITALHDIKITGFDVHLNNNNTLAPSNISVYYKVGTYVGFTTNAAAWTLAGSVSGIVSAGTGVATPLPLTLDINIPAGTTYGIYIVVTNLGVSNSLRYTSAANSAAEGVVAASDYNLQVGTGTVIFGPFTGSLAAPVNRKWNGRVKYSIGCESPRTAVTATVTTAPSVTVGSVTPVCQGQQTTLSVSSSNDPNYTYTWMPGNLIGASVNVSPAATTTYTVTATDLSGGTNSGCAAIGTATAVIRSLPAVAVTPSSSTVCSGTPQVLSVGSQTNTFTFGTQANQNIVSTAAPGYPAPYNLYYGGQRMQMLITAAELIAQGYSSGSQFTELQFPVVSLGSNWGTTVTSCNNFQVSVGATALNSLNAFQTGLTQVIVPGNFTPVVGYGNSHTFNVPFTWDGSSNIIIETTFSNNIGGVANNLVKQYNSPTSFQSCIVYRGDNVSAATVAATTTVNFSYNARPDFKLLGTNVNTYAWTPATGLNTTTGPTVSATLSASQTYTVTATNSYGCSSTSSVGVSVVALPESYIYPDDTTLCTGSVINIVARNNGAYSGGWPVGTLFDYGFGPTPDSTFLVNGPGAYTAQVTLPSGLNFCSAISPVADIVYRDAPVLLNSQQDVSCNGSATAYISSQSFLGSPPYRFKYYNSLGQLIRDTVTSLSEDTLFNIPAGDYAVVVYDTITAASPFPVCKSDSTFITITEPALLVASEAHTVIACNGGSSSVTITATGGTPPYTGEGTFTQPGGNQTYTVTDANGCTAQVNVVITQPTVLTTSPSVVYNACAYTSGTVSANAAGGTTPYEYSWSTGATTAVLSNRPAGTYTVTVTDANGCSVTASAVVAPPGAVAVTSTGTNLLCRGIATGTITLTVSGGIPAYSFLWNGGTTTQNRTGLAAGTYTVTVTDINGCTKTKTTVITQPATTMLINTSQTNVRCFGLTTGVATASPTGGTAPYTYSWNTIPVKTTASITGLTSGVYTCSVTDAIGCAKNVVITITEPTDITVFQTQTNVTFPGGNNGTASVSVSGGTAPYTYSWNTVPVKTTASVTGLTAGTYKCTVTDSKSCIKKVTFIITEPIAKPGTGEATAWNIRAYPNPTSGVIILAFENDAEEQFSLALLDITGRMLMNEERSAVKGQNEFLYDFTGFSKGVYFIRLSSADKSKMIRIVVE